MKKNRKPNQVPLCSIRFFLLCGVLSLGFIGLMGRAVYLQIDESEALNHQADSRSIRTKGITTYRGNIIDRNGVELASSVPLKSVWIDFPTVRKKYPLLDQDEWNRLAAIVEKSPVELRRWFSKRKKRTIARLGRHLDPQKASLIAKLDLKGVKLVNESRRYYPSAEITAHLIGFTNVEDQGQEGLEKSYNNWLTGQQGAEKVLLDRRGQVIEKRDVISEAKTGMELQLSIDSRIQAIAYKALKTAVLKHKAKAGALVMIDIETSEVLALVSQPSYNPNRFDLRLPELTRNRAFTDSFEPGSTAKPFTVTSALESGVVNAFTKIDTSPGRIKVGYKVIPDGTNHGVLDIGGILQKSSNVGVTKLAMMMDDRDFLKAFYKVGFGVDTASGFPGESSGKFNIRPNWSKIEKATLSYGYGFTVTPVQLAQAYAVLGAHGIKRPLSLVKLEQPSIGERVLSQKATSQVVSMMETVVNEGGTGQKASVKGYRIAGKTGTARKAKGGGYGDEYTVFFAGIAPVSNPKIAMVVFVDEPGSEDYYGGQVAAPVFAKVASDSLRLLNVKPDQNMETQYRLTAKNKSQSEVEKANNG
ncbi:MAG: peptidoglycan glycosyltransferase FtsI [Kangiellaceae bacterium]|nr:peptidoglycan glycosyltransferase FtsI [Kangiellaceae bacterium]